MKITAAADVSNVKGDDITRFVSAFLTQIQDIVNGNLSFGDNIKAQVVSANFTAANAQIQIGHTLGKAPIGYILVGSSVAMSLYNGTSANTDQLLYISSTAVGSASVLVF